MNTLHEIRKKNTNSLIIGLLNINALRNKIEKAEEIIKDKIDIFLVSERKLDSSFPSGQFIIKGYRQKPNGGGLLLFIREDIPCTILNEYNPEKPRNIFFFAEINSRSRKWLLSRSYNPNANLIVDHLHCIGRGIDFYSSKYDSFIVVGDLNTEISDLFLEQFCASYNLKSLIKESTCFKSVDNPSCIDLILTKHPRCFQDSGVYETSISDLHKFTFTVLETYFQKAKPRIIIYRDYKRFASNEFRDELIRELSSNNMQSDDFARFTNISKMILQKRHLEKKGMSHITKLNL